MSNFKNNILKKIEQLNALREVTMNLCQEIGDDCRNASFFQSANSDTLFNCGEQAGWLKLCLDEEFNDHLEQLKNLLEKVD